MLWCKVCWNVSHISLPWKKKPRGHNCRLFIITQGCNCEPHLSSWVIIMKPSEQGPVRLTGLSSPHSRLYSWGWFGCFLSPCHVLMWELLTASHLPSLAQQWTKYRNLMGFTHNSEPLGLGELPSWVRYVGFEQNVLQYVFFLKPYNDANILNADCRIKGVIFYFTLLVPLWACQYRSV